MNNWFDEARIEVRSGDGGKGCESYMHRTDRKKVPNGGHGGKGGDVWVEANSNVDGLLHFKFNQHFEAEDGIQGSSAQKAGKSGEDYVIRVPAGTTILNTVGGLRIRDLKASGDRVKVAEGGRGGAGNYVSNTAHPGHPGKRLEIILDLKVQADIFLLGLPSAGKSSLLSQLTNVPLPTKSYPFATKAPVLGVHPLSKYEEVTLCELPSLMRGSHEEHGLGNRYLKHISRGQVCIWVMAPESDFASSLEESYEILRGEIEKYDASYLEYPYICVINKMDCVKSADEKEAIETLVKKWKVPYCLLSAKTGEGIEQLAQMIQGKAPYE
jgi:GTP-binding protein